ncbi:MAG: hypothetical protein GX923_05675 [Clostridia bacterium]|jgi:hypothetical protein|nr:hypothetical protein [Clostridia bacterium]
MECFGCGNCQEEQNIYYCPAQNDFIIKEQTNIPEKAKKANWKKGDPQYESQRRFRKNEI